jgi:hypothetical protein
MAMTGLRVEISVEKREDIRMLIFDCACGEHG